MVTTMEQISLSDLKPGDWALCSICPKCKAADPFMPLPDFDPKDPVRTGLRGALTRERDRTCPKCEHVFRWNLTQGTPRQLPISE
jgi:hypothetical protein